MLQDFLNGKPISCVLVGLEIYGCYYFGGSTQLLKFKFAATTTAKHDYGLHYHKMNSEETAMQLNDIIVSSCRLLLPYELDVCDRDK